MSGALMAMEGEKHPLLSQSIKHKIEHKIIEDVQYTTEVPDFDAVEFDSINPAYLLLGTEKGLVLYDTKNHIQGKSKKLASLPMISVRSSENKNHENVLAFSTGSSIGICNKNKVSAITTTGNQYNPSRVRFLPRATKIVAFHKNKIDFYDSQSLYKGILDTITNNQTIHGVTLCGDDQLIEWDETAVRFWDIRQSLSKKPNHTCTIDAYSVAPNCAKIAVGKSNGAMVLLDKRKLQEPYRSQMLKRDKVVAVNYIPSGEFIAAYGDQVTMIDADKGDIKSSYDFQCKNWEQKPTWIGCKATNEIAVLNWLATCDQEKSDSVKLVTSIVNLKKARDAHGENK